MPVLDRESTEQPDDGDDSAYDGAGLQEHRAADVGVGVS